MKKFLFYFSVLFFSWLQADEVIPINQVTHVQHAAVPVGSNPTDIAVCSHFAFVVNQGSDNVTIIDRTTFSTRTINVAPNPVSCALGKFGVYFVSSGTPSYVTYYDFASSQTLALGEIGANAKPIAVAYGLKTFIVNTDSNSVSVYDDSVTPPVFLTTVSVGLQPVAVAVGSSFVYVVCKGDSTVWPINISTLLPLSPINTDGKELIDIITEFDTAYVLDKGNEEVISLNHTSVLKRLKVGSNPTAIKKFFNGPHHVNWAIIVNNSSGSFTPIDLLNSQKGSDVIIGGTPTNVLAGFNLFFTNPANNELIVVDDLFNILSPIPINHPGAMGASGISDIFVVDNAYP